MVVLQRAARCSWHTWAQHSGFFLFPHSLNHCWELHAIRTALCNSQDSLLSFLLSTTSSLWAVICSLAQSCFWFPSLLIVPLVFLNCSPCPTFFLIWGYVSSLVRESRLENERNASSLFVKKSYSPFHLKAVNLGYSWYGFKTCIPVLLNIWGAHV